MIIKQIQHRTKKKFLNKEQLDFINEKYPEIKDEDMVEIIETRSLELNNTWEGK